ncbi:MAG: glutaminase [Psychroflexus sp.]|nr:glutaminase [Psychroflexus sp.]
MDFKNILNIIYKDCSRIENHGKIANYIPELAKVNPDKFGMFLLTNENEHYEIGDSQEKFSIQSLSKVISLTIATELIGQDLWKRVEVEPSGTPFNSLTELERDKGIPRNPFINAGAIVVADVLLSVLDNPIDDFLTFIRKLADDDQIFYNEKVAKSEKDFGYRNTALVNYMKALDNIENEVDDILNFYYHQCAIDMTCEQLAKTFSIFANSGKKISTNEQVISAKSVKRINAIIQTCGFYDEPGEFAFRGGLPGKRGVGGGIVAVHPKAYVVVIWSPKLNTKGNSNLGIHALEDLTNLSGLSVF